MVDRITEIDKEIKRDKNGFYVVGFTYTTSSGCVCYDKMYFNREKDAAQHIKKIENMIRGYDSNKRIL